MKKGNICLVSCARNAGMHLREWFIYHRAIGITAFYIVDHQPSEDETSAIIAEFADVIVTKTGPYKESEWFKEICNRALSDGAAAVFANDTDEFLCGNGAPFAARVQEVLSMLPHGGGHLLTPGFNMVPQGAADGEDGGDWRRHVYARPNKIWSGKSALYLSSKTQVQVISGGQHYLKTSPLLPISTCPKRTQSSIVSPLNPKYFPVYYLHFTFFGPSAYLRRIQTLMLTPWNAILMVQRYGKGIVNAEHLEARNITQEDIADFSKFMEHSPQEIYRRAVRSSAISANEVRSDIAHFFKLETTSEWSEAEHRRILAYWGVPAEQIENLSFPVKSRAEDLQ
jgi:hypothetical protein